MARLAFEDPVMASAGPSSGNRREGLRFPFRPVVIIILALLAIVAVGCGGSAEAAADFKFTLFQGESQLGATEGSIYQQRNKPLVLNFWAGLCPPCRAEMPDFQDFYDEYSDRVALIGIDIGQFTGLGSPQDAKGLLEELDIDYPAGYTDDGSVVQKYRVLGVPTTVFIDAEGNIFKTWGGALNAQVLREQTDAMLSQ